MDVRGNARAYDAVLCHMHSLIGSSYSIMNHDWMASFSQMPHRICKLLFWFGINENRKKKNKKQKPTTNQRE